MLQVGSTFSYIGVKKKEILGTYVVLIWPPESSVKTGIQIV